MFEPTKRKNFGWADDRKNCQIGHQQSNVFYATETLRRVMGSTPKIIAFQI